MDGVQTRAVCNSKQLLFCRDLLCACCCLCLLTHLHTHTYIHPHTPIHTHSFVFNNTHTHTLMGVPAAASAFSTAASMQCCTLPHMMRGSCSHHLQVVHAKARSCIHTYTSSRLDS